MPDVEIPTWVGWLIIAGAAIGALRAMVRTRVVRWVKDAAARSVTDAVRAVVKDEIAPLRDELKPNGGVTVRDAIDRIEQAGYRTEQKLDDHIEWSERDRSYLHERLNGTIETNELTDPEEPS